MSSRWERILDQKPQELRDYVLEKVADQLAGDLHDFPPPIDEWLERLSPGLTQSEPGAAGLAVPVI